MPTHAGLRLRCNATASAPTTCNMRCAGPPPAVEDGRRSPPGRNHRTEPDRHQTNNHAHTCRNIFSVLQQTLPRHPSRNKNRAQRKSLFMLLEKKFIHALDLQVSCEQSEYIHTDQKKFETIVGRKKNSDRRGQGRKSCWLDKNSIRCHQPR